MWFNRRVRGLGQGTDLRGHRSGRSDEPPRHVALLQNNRALTRQAPGRVHGAQYGHPFAAAGGMRVASRLSDIVPNRLLSPA